LRGFDCCTPKISKDFSPLLTLQHEENQACCVADALELVAASNPQVQHSIGAQYEGYSAEQCCDRDFQAEASSDSTDWGCAANQKWLKNAEGKPGISRCVSFGME
jgi:hypothetical protein